MTQGKVYEWLSNPPRMFNDWEMDEETFRRIGPSLAGMLAQEFFYNPQLVVEGYERLQKSFDALDAALRSMPTNDLDSMVETAGVVKCGAVWPMQGIKKAADAIKAGKEYELVGLGSFFVIALHTQAMIRSRAYSSRS